MPAVDRGWLGEDQTWLAPCHPQSTPPAKIAAGVEGTQGVVSDCVKMPPSRNSLPVILIYEDSGNGYKREELCFSRLPIFVVGAVSQASALCFTKNVCHTTQGWVIMSLTILICFTGTARRTERRVEFSWHFYSLGRHTMTRPHTASKRLFMHEQRRYSLPGLRRLLGIVSRDGCPAPVCSLPFRVGFVHLLRPRRRHLPSCSQQRFSFGPGNLAPGMLALHSPPLFLVASCRGPLQFHDLRLWSLPSQGVDAGARGRPRAGGGTLLPRVP